MRHIRRLQRWARNHAIALVVLFVAAGFTITAQVVITQDEQNDAADAAEALERRAEICEAFKKSQQTDRLLIDTVLQEDGGQGIPLLDVPAYEGLPEDIKVYIRQIAEGVPPGPNDPPDLAERLAKFRDENLGRDDLPEFCL